MLIFAVARPFPGKGDPPLSYVVEGQAGTSAGFVQGERDVGTSLVFSDGSRFHLRPHTVGRVLSSTATGAVVLVEHGQAQVQVRHRATTEWSVYAGPFIVRVTGTQFDLSWSASERTLELKMKEGSVVVQGPRLDGGVRLVAGQTLRAPADGEKIEVTGPVPAAPIPPVPAPSVPTVAPEQTERPVARAPKARLLAASHVDRPQPSVTGHPPGHPPAEVAVAVEREVVHDSPSPSPSLAPSPSPSLTPSPSSSPSPPPALPPAFAPPPRSALPPPSPKVAPPNWAERVAAGDFETVLASARADGIQRCLTERPAEDLFALADAARYAGNRKLAIQALLKVRGRFPHAAEAKTAAFLLGRLSEQQEAHAAAVEWFNRYLEEAPKGPYAGLAFGHKMLLVGKVGGRVNGEELARDYLARYPDGPYAGAARDLLKNP
ncbi:MAG TPA: tetratricopeptide repeat protein [Polyangia bacterium]|nr:tetratricopeptide repeat protein [Polyangia bacterium]